MGVCTHLDHLISVRGVGYGASVKTGRRGGSPLGESKIKYNTAGTIIGQAGTAKEGLITSCCSELQEVCPLHLLLPHHHFSSASSQGPFLFFFFRTERKRSVAENSGEMRDLQRSAT